MANMTIKNIPDELYQLLKDRAKQNRRSINNEAIVCLEKAVREREIGRDVLLDRIRARREKMTGLFLTEEDVNAAKNEGRP